MTGLAVFFGLAGWLAAQVTALNPLHLRISTNTQPQECASLEEF